MLPIESRKAVVFGANGSIGSETVRQLSEKRISTTAVVRPGKASSIHEAEYVEAVEADLSRHEDISTALVGATEIYFTPANFTQGRTRPEWLRNIHSGTGFREAYAVNVTTPLQIHEIAQKEGVERMVYLSSIAVYGAQGGEVSETTALKGKGIYAVTKRLGEEQLLAAQESTAVTIMRPANVFGPGAEIWSEALYQRFSHTGNKGRFIPGTGGGKMQPVDIRDVAGAMIRSVEIPAAASEIYNLASDDNLSVKEIAAYFQILTEIAPQLTPRVLVEMFGRALDITSVATGRGVTVSHESIKNLLDDTRTISNVKAKQELEMQFRSAEETMRDSLLWLDQRHNLGKKEKITEIFAKER